MSDESYRLRPVVYVRRRRRRPGDIASGVTYSIAVVVMVALGAMFYGAYHKAQKDAAPRYSSAEMPGKIVGVMTAGTNIEPVLEPVAEPAPRRVELPASKEEPRAASKKGLQPIVVAVPRRTDVMPDIRPVSRVPWTAARGDLSNPLEAKLTPTADTIVAAPPFQDRNGGSLPLLALNGRDRIVLARFDVTPAAGWTLARATWHCKVAKGRLSTLSFSTVPVDWEEGAGDMTVSASSGATYQGADGPDTPWTKDRLPLPALLLGHGGSRVAVAEPDNPDHATGDWISYEVKPEIVQALISGTASGLAIMDEKGQLALDAAVASREDVEFSHYLVVEGRPIDLVPPAQVEGFYAYAHPDLRGAKHCGALLTWLAPGDDEMQGQAYRYEVRYAPADEAQSFEEAARIPMNRVPFPLPSGQEEQLVVDGLLPDTAYTFHIRSADEAGQFGPVSQTSVTTAPPLALDERISPRSFDGAPVDLALGQVTMDVMDELMALGAADDSGTSFLWDKASRSLHLIAARGDVAALALRFRSKTGALPSFSVEPQPLVGPGGEVAGIETRLSEVVGGVLENSDGQLQARQGPEGRTVLLEFAVADDARPGMHRSKIKVSVPGKPEANINVFMTVSNVQLPDPAFVVEMAAEISPVADAREADWIALARAHRCSFMPIPYSRNGEAPEPLAPPVAGEGQDVLVTSWKDWDARFAPFLNADPKCIVLPLFEGWPKPFVDGYTCADQEVQIGNGLKAYAGPSKGVGGCLSADFGLALAAAAGEFGKHFKESGRDTTDGHVWFLTEPSTTYAGFVPPWNLGQPATRDDLAALAVLGDGVMGGARLWRGGQLVLRVSIPDLRVLDDVGIGLFGLLAVSDTNLCLWSLAEDRVALGGEKIWLQTDYQGFMDPAQVAGLVLGAYLRGAEGWTLLGADRGVPESLFDSSSGSPHPTLRLKLMRRLQADLDLLGQLQERRQWTRAQLGEYVQQYVSIQDCRPSVRASSLRLLRQATLEALGK